MSRRRQKKRGLDPLDLTPQERAEYEEYLREWQDRFNSASRLARGGMYGFEDINREDYDDDEEE